MIGLKYDNSHSRYCKNNAGSIREHYYAFGIVEGFDLDLPSLKGKVESTDV